MKNIILLGFLFLFVLISNGQNKKVLIIGNSLMSFNKMPETLQMMMDLNDKNIIIDQFTKEGGNLAGYIDNYDFGRIWYINLTKQKDKLSHGDSKERLKKVYKYNFDIDTIHHSTLEKLLINNRYDLIFIQEHGSIINSDLGLKYKGFKSLERFYQLIPNTTKVVYFSEYPPNDFLKSKKKEEERTIYFHFVYDTLNCFPLSKIDSSRLDSRGFFMHDKLVIKYNALALNKHTVANLNLLKTKFPISIAPTSDIFIRLKQKHPAMKMYRIAGHPSAKASYMFATVYYYMITEEFNTKMDNTNRLRVSKKNEKRIQDEVITYFNDLDKK